MNFKIKIAIVSLKDSLNTIHEEFNSIHEEFNSIREDFKAFREDVKSLEKEAIAYYKNINEKEELELLELQNPTKKDVTTTNATTIDSESVISTVTNVYENIKGTELIINTRINEHENVSTTRQKKNKKNDDQSVLVEPTTHQYNLRSNNVFKNHTSTSIHIYEPKNKRHRL
jgi:Tol biopolymer transport system component